MNKLCLLSALLLGTSLAGQSQERHTEDVLRNNQIGYLSDDIKVAVYLGNTPVENLTFSLCSDGQALPVDSVVSVPAWEPMSASARIYFSAVTEPGTYTLVAKDTAGNEVLSSAVYIGDDAYSRYKIQELPLNYLRQQRCGDNPVFGEPCHQHDGFLVLSGDRDGKAVDVRGGWHDASDFLQYLTTSANTVYQLLFAYQQNPNGWADEYDATGRPGANGIPDILDEARHGLEWMLRMNPEPGLYLNQIADDRDHRFAGLPAADNVDYGWGAGAGRPVYPCSGTPYGLMDNLNDSKGLASSVGKFVSSFGLGAEIFKNIDSDFATTLSEYSEAAYPIAVANPGACQTAPCVSPYYYEEDNYADDMELAAMIRYRATKDAKYLREAVDYGRLEPVTPWMGADSAHHYQWYPFLNLGHYQLAQVADKRVAREFQRNMRAGLQRVAERGAENAFRYGIPFIWCSNNLAVAYVTQGMLYRSLTGDNTYREAETAVRDWLFGCNPWGQVMIMMPIGLDGINSPSDPHSTIIDLTVNGKPGRYWLTGGLVDGPVYANIFNTLRGVHLRHDDRFAPYQNSLVVYHDDYSDYSTNEPTMDGTASLCYMLSQLCKPKRSGVNFAILSDTHVSPGTEAETSLCNAIDEINAADFDFVIVNGDLTNQGADDELHNMKRLLDRVRHPLYVVPGNHENNWSQSATKTFTDLWGADRFAFTQDSLVFVDINCGPYMKMGDGHVKREDLLWLKSTLDSLAQPGFKVVSLNHYPIRKDDLDSWEAYAELLTQYPTIIHINGHYHHWDTYQIEGTNIPGVMVRALDMRDDTPGYAIVDIDTDSIRFFNKRTGLAAEPKFSFSSRVPEKVAKSSSPRRLKPKKSNLNTLFADNASIFTRLAFDADNVYFGNSLGYAKAVNKTTGEVAWEIPTGAPIYSRPVVLNNGNVAFPTATGIIIADAATGVIVKEFSSEEGPYVADGLISGDNWIQGGYKRLECRDASSGEIKWVYRDIDNYCQASPTIAGDDVIFGAWDCYLRNIDLNTGKLKWKWSNGSTQRLYSPGNVVPVVNDDYVIILAPDRYMTCLRRSDGSELWRDHSHRYRESLGAAGPIGAAGPRPAAHQPSIALAKTMDGELIAVDATSPTFHELWALDMGLGYEHAPCIILQKDNMIYAGSRRGIVTAVNADIPSVAQCDSLGAAGPRPAAQNPSVAWQETIGYGEINGFDLDPYTGLIYLSLIDGTIFQIP